ncbi:MAG TPA: hypothetical protein VHX38_21475 [Pseudonocardiaceae bacterium]|nr:hypothetical protein [Pseudonocardiaceae bacterium]
MIKDRRQVARRIIQLARRLDDLTVWTRDPDSPFPVDDVELGEFLGEVAVLLIAGGRAPGDGPSADGGGTACRC